MAHNGIGACVLGAADPDVDQAVVRAIAAGGMSTLNAPEEVALAELLCELHPWARMVRFARGGGEAMAIAVRIARAATGREQVAFCGYHGWHDWYLAANLTGAEAPQRDGGRPPSAVRGRKKPLPDGRGRRRHGGQPPQDAAAPLDRHLLPGLDPAGVPRGLRGTLHAFEFNRLDQLEAIVAAHGDELAAVVLEPQRGTAPAPAFLRGARDAAARCGAVLVFDEITSAWRLNAGGVHLLHDVTPDVAVFAKAMSNGYAMAAIIGVDAVMDAAQRSFISSTYWTERLGPAAALATIRKHRACNVAEHLIAIGRRVQEGWREAARDAGLSVRVDGMPPLAHLAFECEAPDAARTLFTQEMLKRGFLAGDSFYATFAHHPRHVDAYLDHVRPVFALISRAIEERRIESLLEGPVAHRGFRRLT